MQRAFCLAMVAMGVTAMGPSQVAAQASPPRCPPGAVASDCTTWYHDFAKNDYHFKVQGKHFSIIYEDGKSIELRCNKGGADVQSPALPGFEMELRVEHVTVTECLSSKYADVLSTMNVTTRATINLTLVSPVGLAGAHLEGLPPVRDFTVSGAGSPGPLLPYLGCTLGAGCPALTVLSLSETKLEPADLAKLPPALVDLTLWDTNVTHLPAKLLALGTLRSLTVESPDMVSMDGEFVAVSKLRHLVVREAEGDLLAKWLPPELRVVCLKGWRAESPPTVPTCAALESLTLITPRVRTLPAEWVARCGNLTTLEVMYAVYLTELPARLLANAFSLKTLIFKLGALASLPPDLFDATPLLEHLDLRSNHLKQLPSGLLNPVRDALHDLTLDENSFGAGVAAALRDLWQLRRLSLASNPIEDLCPRAAYDAEEQNKSSLESLSKLEFLNLKKTNVTVICVDWRTVLQSLTKLDLSYTKIETLGFQDLQFRWSAKGSVNLQNIPLRRLFFTHKDYEEMGGGGAGSSVTVEFSGPGSNLTCDCDLYWWTLGVEEGRMWASGAGELQCAGGGALRDVRARERVCPAPPAACPAGLPPACACVTVRAHTVLRVSCERAGLTRVPRPRNLTDISAVDLRLAGNDIRNITSDDIPQRLLNLDLQNNSIKYISESTARALVPSDAGEEWRVFLAGNPLQCGCEGASARRVLRDHAGLLEGYEAGSVRCAGGTALVNATDVDCPTPASSASPRAEPPASPSVVLPTALAAVVVVATVGAGLLAARYGALRWLKEAVWWMRRAPTPGDDRPYDVFVTYAAGEEKRALEMTAQLERGGRRVLLQERDWLPPAWVPACLATSARVAQATVALVTPAWERALLNAEVRAAFDGALLVLVVPGRGDPQDTALRRYARDFPARVVQRGCWRRLERALPPLQDLTPPAPI